MIPILLFSVPPISNLRQDTIVHQRQRGFKETQPRTFPTPIPLENSRQTQLLITLTLNPEPPITRSNIPRPRQTNNSINPHHDTQMVRQRPAPRMPRVSLLLPRIPGPARDVKLHQLVLAPLVRWAAHVQHGGKAAPHAGEPVHGRPADAREEVHPLVVRGHVRHGSVGVAQAGGVVEAAGEVERDAEEAEGDEGPMEGDEVVEQEDAGAVDEGRAARGVPLVQVRVHGAGGSEADGGAAEAQGQQEGAQDGDGVVRG